MALRRRRPTPGLVHHSDRGVQYASGDYTDLLKANGIAISMSRKGNPYDNGVAERWVGVCRRDLLDHVIVLNERHLKRLMNEYVRYYHEDRTHLGLSKQTPADRETASGTGSTIKVVSMPRLGGLHHRYNLAA